jgi:septal ring factor EnvC (AmiA/AmiB activator)
MKKEKTIHELSKEFPEKTYKELEKYRDADRLEEAVGIGHNNPPNEGEEQDNPTLWDIATTHNVSYADAVPIQEDMRLKRDALKAACTLAEMRKDRTPLELMKKRAEEAEGELSIMKGIETNRVKEAQARCDHLQSELDRVKKENNDLFNRVADSLEVNESHQKFNGKLQERLTELEEENKKMHDHLNKQVENARKSGM